MKRFNTITFCIQVFLCLCILSCNNSANKNSENENENENLLKKNWSDIKSLAKGQSLTLMMWQGDFYISKYIKEYVTEKLKKDFNIELKVVSGQGNQIVNTLMAEKEAIINVSEIDLVWINGETFYQLRQFEALYGPFVSKLPNSKYLDLENPFISMDFQEPIDGYECPWGNVQMSLIYNSQKIKNPPNTIEEFEEWIKNNPGKFTIGNNFTGFTFLKSWLINLAGGNEALKGEFNDDKYKIYSTQLWNKLIKLKPYLWNQGNSFPPTVAQMHKLFANGELYMTMSNNNNEIVNKMKEGVFPSFARAYVPLIGTIQNSHYMGITINSSQKAAALVTINYLISPEAQWKKNKLDVWGDGTVLNLNKLPQEWKLKFDLLSEDNIFAPNKKELNDKALFELHAEYMIRIAADFRKIIIEN